LLCWPSFKSALTFERQSFKAEGQQKVNFDDDPPCLVLALVKFLYTKTIPSEDEPGGLNEAGHTWKVLWEISDKYNIHGLGNIALHNLSFEAH